MLAALESLSRYDAIMINRLCQRIEHIVGARSRIPLWICGEILLTLGSVTCADVANLAAGDGPLPINSLQEIPLQKIPLQKIPLPIIKVASDQSGFVTLPENQRFVPWGLNYDHDRDGALLEDYWEQNWSVVEQDFAEMRLLGANAVRIHLQLARFMKGPNEPNEAALGRLEKLLQLAESNRVYLNLTGLACYHKQDVPDWYDALTESDRWQTQAHFWRAVARVCCRSPAVFCFDLMNEPVVPGGKREPGGWLGPAFAGKHFVQFITLDQAGRARSEIARQWTRRLVSAIREVDSEHLITVGLVDWSLNRPGLTSGFEPQVIGAEVDFLSVHIYPERGKVDSAMETLRGFAVGKPIVIEETFPLKSGIDEFEQFMRRSQEFGSGWFGFYWGKTLAECREANTIGDAILAQWLEYFKKKKI